MHYWWVCKTCKDRSYPVVDPNNLTEIESFHIRAFKQKHHRTCSSFQVTARYDLAKPVACDPFGAPIGQPRPAPQFTPKPHGYFFYTGPNGEEEKGMLFQCCHCGKIHEVRKGIEKRCGICPKCKGGKHGGFICGPTCAECVPIEQRLENIEAGRPEETARPTKVLVPEIGGLDNGNHSSNSTSTENGASEWISRIGEGDSQQSSAGSELSMPEESSMGS